MSTLFAQNRRKIKKLSFGDEPYLCFLAEIPDPPKQLFCLGELPKSRLPTVAIVGSRKPSIYGREVTQALAEKLARRGVVIVSGLALGVDAIAHQAALDAGGVTIAVQANGLHALNPRSNRLIGESIIERGGAIISEYEPGVEPLKHRFLARNRLVSGIADAIVVTEAAARSGTLNTAAHALEQGRDVYAIPGNITNPMSAGCNALIAQGASPLTSIDDFVATYTATDEPAQVALPIGQNDTENAILTALSEGVRDGDQLLARADCTASEFNTTMTMLEIQGVIAPLGANQWRLH